MRQLYQPLVIIKVRMKSGEVIKKKTYCSLRYGEIPQDKIETYHDVKEFMDKYSPHYVHWYCTILERNMWKKIELYNSSRGNYEVLKICDIDYITVSTIYNTKVYSMSLKELCDKLDSDEFLQYLYDKEKEFKGKDILESLKK